MARVARTYIKFPSAHYHIFTHIADELPYLLPSEKEHLLRLLRRLTSLFNLSLLAYAIMGNHIHLVVKTHPEDQLTDQEALRRALALYSNPAVVLSRPSSYWRSRLSDISFFAKELFQRFAQWRNLRLGRRGHGFRDRFRSVLLEGERAALAACVYVDLNPARAGLSRSAERYRWTSYAARRAGAAGWLLDMKELGLSLADYGEVLDAVGRMQREGKASLSEEERARLLHIVSYRGQGLVYGAEEFVGAVLAKFPHRRRVKWRGEGIVLA